MAGLGFMLPGYFMMLLATYLYEKYGLTEKYVSASFKLVQACVSALVFRAVHRLSEHSFQDNEKHQFSFPLFFIGFASVIQSVIKINFFITMAFSGAVYHLYKKKKYNLMFLLCFCCSIVYCLYVAYVGYPKSQSFVTGLFDCYLK